MIGIISFVLVFGLLIFVHEFGHFVAAKLAGVRVEEFGFGYPPRLLQLGTWRGTKISLNMLPVGGFVRMSEGDPTAEGSLASRGRGVRALVYVAGALMNAVLAIGLYSIIFMAGALTPVEGPGAGVYYVAPKSPADLAGIRLGDTIVSIDGRTVRDVEHAVELVNGGLGQLIEIVVRRNDKVLPPILATPRVSPPPNEGALGVALDLPLMRRSYPPWEAIPLGFRTGYGVVRAVAHQIVGALRGELPLQVSGPIGIYRTTKEVAKTGVEQLLEFTAFLSLNLFLVNLLPLPALDGGHLIFVLLEWVRGGRRVSPEKEGFVHTVGMIALLAFMVVVAVLDYRRYYG